MKKFIKEFKSTLRVLKIYISFFAELEQVKRAVRWIKDILKLVVMFYASLIMLTFLVLTLIGVSASTPVWILSISFFIFCFTYASTIFEKA
jgi:hypothetical protein